MKKTKKKKSIFDQKVNLTIAERLSNVKLGAFQLKKLEESNLHREKMKSLPK